MRIKFFTAILLILISNILSASDISGYWFNPRLQESIRIFKNQQFIFVKGLFSKNRTSKFKSKGRGVFVDKEGNSLILENRNTLKLRRRYANDYIRFEKVRDVDGHNDWKKFHDYDDDFEISRNNFDISNTDDVYKANRSNQIDLYSRLGNNTISSTIPFEELAGTWEANDRRYPTVAIIDHREGLKAKFTGSTNWITYVLSKVGRNEFIDTKGNKYIFDTPSKAKWIPADPNAKIIEVVKTSSEVRY
jgi:hypothetical protein